MQQRRLFFHAQKACSQKKEKKITLNHGSLFFSSGIAKLGYPFYSGLSNPAKSPLSSGRSGMDFARTLPVRGKQKNKNKTKEKGVETLLWKCIRVR